MKTENLVRHFISERARLGLSYGEAAQILGVAPSTLCRIEKGNGNPAPKIAEKISAWLRLSADMPSKEKIKRGTLQTSDLIGKRFGRLVVLEFSHREIGPTGKGYSFWKTRCDCGKEKLTSRNCLTTGQALSCGCYAHDQRTTHDMSSKGRKPHRLWRVWSGIKRRCYAPEAAFYHRYGGRGITMCELWRNDFLSFYSWAVANGWKDGLHIDRINNDGNYCPENCRFVTPKENVRNRSGALKVLLNGEVMSLAHAAETLQVSYHAMHQAYSSRNLSKYRAFGIADAREALREIGE